MSRKRKSDQPTTEQSATTATALAEQDHTRPIESQGEQSNFAERLSRAGAVATPDPFEIAGDYLAGVHLFESRQDRQMALKFEDKPDQAVIAMLKEAGYRWNPTDRIWSHPVSRESAMSTRIDAERLYQDVRQVVRQSKGIEAGQEISF